MFGKREQVYGPETVSVGDFDITVDGCYRNVVTIPLDVRPHRMLRVSVKSDHPVDVAVAREDHSAAGHKDGVMPPSAPSIQASTRAWGYSSACTRATRPR